MNLIQDESLSASQRLSIRTTRSFLQGRRTTTASTNSVRNIGTNSNSVGSTRSMTDRLQSRLSNSMAGISANLDRILGQADQIQSLYQSSTGTTSTGSGSMALSPDLQTYIQMIRQLAGDNKAMGKYLDQFESFLSGEQGQSQTVSQYLNNLGQQFQINVSAVSYSSSQTIIRSGTNTQVAENTQTATSGQTVQSAEPLVFDLNGNGLDLTTVEDGVRFDITGDGVQEQTAFVTGEDAFLALDRNGNGRIDDGNELFGDQHGAANGIEELRKFDQNGDGAIDESDGIFDQLRLFVDENGDGVSQDGELRTLADENITRISLNALEESRRIAGNRLAASTYFERNDGSRSMVGEMYLNYIA